MPLPITRRGFAKTSVAAVVGLGSLATLARYSPASAEEAKLLPNDVLLTPDIEPLVRLIEVTPRERIVSAMIERLRKGMTYRQLLTAMFLASTRMAVSPHHFYMIHAAHQLSLNGGSEERLLPLFWLRLGGRTGSGRQWLSWIHRDDLVRLILHAIADDRVRGALNAAAPNPVRNGEFAHALGIALWRPALLPAPAWALWLMLGQMAGELLLAGPRVAPGQALATGFRFEHPDLEGALAAVLGARANRPRRLGYPRSEGASLP